MTENEVKTQGWQDGYHRQPPVLPSPYTPEEQEWYDAAYQQGQLERWRLDDRQAEHHAQYGPPKKTPWYERAWGWVYTRLP